MQLRVSQASDTSIESQRMSARKICTSHGWSFRPEDEFVEEVSASEFGEAHRLARKKPKDRDEFNRLLSALNAGQYDVLVVTEVSRTSRDIEYLGKLAKACTRNDVKLCVGDRLMDLSESADFTLVAIEGVLAQGEAKRLSKRSLRGHEAARAEGRPTTGPAPFGYFRPPREAKAPVYQVPHPIQAGLIRWAVVDAIPAGASLSYVAEVWGAAPGANGIPTRATVRKAILNPAIIGMRTRIGQPPLPGNWEPLVTLEQYDKCAQILSSPKRRRSSSHEPTTLLTGIGTCSVCGTPVRLRHAPEGDRYSGGRMPSDHKTCRHLSRPVDEIDSAAITALKAELVRLTIQSVRQHAAATAPTNERRVTLLRDYEEAQDRLNNFRKSWVKLKFTPEDAAAAIRQYQEDVDEIRRQIPDEAPQEPGDSIFDQAVAEIRADGWSDAELEFAAQMYVNTRWDKMGLMERRDLMRSHMTIEITGRKSPLFDPATNGVTCTSRPNI